MCTYTLSKTNTRTHTTHPQTDLDDVDLSHDVEVPSTEVWSDLTFSDLEHVWAEHLTEAQYASYTADLRPDSPHINQAAWDRYMQAFAVKFKREKDELFNISLKHCKRNPFRI